MSVRAKFYVQAIKSVHIPSPTDVCAIVELAAVYGEDNKNWSKHTPQGKIEMTITNQAAIDYFDLGGEVFVTFEKPVKRETVSLTANDLILEKPNT